MNNPRIAHTFKINVKISIIFPFRYEKAEVGGASSHPRRMDKRAIRRPTGRLICFQERLGYQTPRPKPDATY